MIAKMIEAFQRRVRTGRRLMARGYTVVEVMMALSVLSIGATGIVAMQKVTLLSNTNARDLATASAIASAWIERLHTDARTWTFDNASGGTTLANTQYLNQGQGVWFIPANGLNVNAGAIATADVKGNDDATTPAFCTNIRLTTLLDSPLNECEAGGDISGCCDVPGGQSCPAVIRAEVRVYWLKLHNSTDTDKTGALAGSFCTAAEIAAGIEDDEEGAGRYHFVYATSAILRTDP